MTGGVVFAALAVSGALLWTAGEARVGVGLLAAAGATLLWMLLGGKKGD